MSTPSTLSAISKIRLLLTRKDKIKWLGIVGFALLTSMFEMLTASVIMIFVQVMSQPECGQKYFIKLGFNENLSPTKMIFYITIAVGIIYLIKNIIAAGEIFYQNFSIQNMSYDFKNKMLNKYYDIDYGTHLTRNSSLGLQVIGNIDWMFSNGMLPISVILSEGMVFICLIGMVIYINPSLAIAIFGICIFLGFAIKRILPKFYQLGQKLHETLLYVNQNLTQFFHAFKDIVLLGKRRAFIEAYNFHSKKLSKIQYLFAAANSLPRILIETLFVGIFVTIIAILTLKHNDPTQMVGILGGYFYTVFRLMPEFSRIIGQLNTFKSAIPAIEQVFNEYTFVAAKENYISIPSLKFENNIIIKNLSFRYLNTERNALSNVSFEIKKGECIGIVGETGSGKSTLVDVILGLLRPYKGSILIDDKYPVNTYQWHKMIGYVPQSIYLTDDTIEANIAFGEKEIDETRLNQVIDAAQLRKFINLLPQKEKTIVSERGIRLSGGERQRISIARALYRNPKVLIFDEATSALDNETESRLMETINAISKSHTVIMIAHRLTTLKDCDRIIVMEEGHLKHIESHQNSKKSK